MTQDKSSQTERRSARRTRERARRFSSLTEAQAALGWSIILVLVALLGAIYLSQASRIATVGRRVQVQQNQLQALKRENSALERRIAEAQSLERLQQEAIRLGFIQAQPDDIEYLIVPDYPPESSAAAAVEATPEPTPVPLPPETMHEAIWLSVKASIGNLISGESNEQ